MKLKAVILAILVILGIMLSLYVYRGIVDDQVLSAILFSIAFLLAAMFAAKIAAEFRQLNKYLRARNRIQAIILPLVGDERHASVLAENLVLRKTKLENWPEIPENETHEIKFILSKTFIDNKKAPRNSEINFQE
ncbi:MAG: hypothetical protein KGL39_08210 [Patescibacteria group bacterium]|nr:hypothetical protein [Patescibacteria group bacterium]